MVQLAPSKTPSPDQAPAETSLSEKMRTLQLQPLERQSTFPSKDELIKSLELVRKKFSDPISSVFQGAGISASKTFIATQPDLQKELLEVFGLKSGKFTSTTGRAGLTITVNGLRADGKAAEGWVTFPVDKQEAIWSAGIGLPTPK